MGCIMSMVKSKSTVNSEWETIKKVKSCSNYSFLYISTVMHSIGKTKPEEHSPHVAGCWHNKVGGGWEPN